MKGEFCYINTVRLNKKEINKSKLQNFKKLKSNNKYTFSDELKDEINELK